MYAVCIMREGLFPWLLSWFRKTKNDVTPGEEYLIIKKKKNHTSGGWEAGQSIFPEMFLIYMIFRPFEERAQELFAPAELFLSTNRAKKARKSE